MPDITHRSDAFNFVGATFFLLLFVCLFCYSLGFGRASKHNFTAALCDGIIQHRIFALWLGEDSHDKGIPQLISTLGVVSAGRRRRWIRTLGLPYYACQGAWCSVMEGPPFLAFQNCSVDGTEHTAFRSVYNAGKLLTT